MTTLHRHLIGMLAAMLIIGILIGLPIILVEVGGNPLPDQLPALSDVGRVLTSPDDGTLAVAAIILIAWTVWLTLAGSILIEATSRLRGITTPALPGLRLPQLAARSLVTAALLLFATTPQQVHYTIDPAAPPVVTGGPHGPAETPHRPTDAQTPLAAGNRGKVETVPYRVRSGDSLWSIARDQLGSGARYREIAELNTQVLGGRPDFITPGTILRLPTTTGTDQDRAAHIVTVQRGDTLSEIAEEELGDADRYPEIFKASKPITQPGNQHLSTSAPQRPRRHRRRLDPQNPQTGAKKRHCSQADQNRRRPPDHTKRSAPLTRGQADTGAVGHKVADRTTDRHRDSPADGTSHAAADAAVFGRYG
jgi:LysM repeat protein